MINGKIDLRSDTVTIPTDKMRKAMFEAEVGDDVYGDDPSINQLEELAAEMFEKEAALFVPSGTMSNQLALFAHADRGNEVILPDNCHIVVHEAGAAAILSGVQLRCIQTKNGEMPFDIIEKTIRKTPEDIHSPKTALITYENADSDGMVRSVEYMKKIKAIAEKYQLAVHIDGARIFNAATALGIDVKEMAPYFDSISVCLSKGLCAPVGSVLIGSRDFIASARRKRKILGGGMRQAGFLAAVGMIALEEMTKRLQEDHENAKYLSQRLQEVQGIHVLEERTCINMVFFELLQQFGMDSHALVKAFESKNILINDEDNGVIRFVTNYYVNKKEIDFVVDTMKSFAL